MAKAILTELLANSTSNQNQYEVLSAGLSTLDGLPASPEAIETMAAVGLDISSHMSQQLKPELMLSADYVLTMTKAQCNYLQKMYPERAANIFTISEFAGKGDQDIVDPFGQGLVSYKECMQQLKELLPGVVNKLQEDMAFKKKVAIGSDHAGFELKREIINSLVTDNYEVLDCGTFSNETVDYPDIAEKVAEAVLDQGVMGIIICGTGIGISIAANKIPGIRAALCYNPDTASLARRHNDANIVAIGARMFECDQAWEIVKTFLVTGFEAGRHQRRIDKIKQIEKKWLEGAI